MGYIVYDGEILEFKVEDRLLAHLQIVIVNKFRKNESFMFSWKEPIETGDGRSTVWLSPNIGLRFKFAGSRTIEINPTWLAALYASAASGRGLYPEAEPAHDPGTHLPGVTGDHVDWASDRPEPPKTRAARPPVGTKAP
ncbi:ATP-dependent DNA ligase [Frigoribacterium sp. CFBP9039]|nr:ATP-dependent DNA ligase [Frigoribacterium sp. CFBP9039]MDY0947153.1 ATP-dependent DNA ligase [Frigoribacterium sp. CFBP9039]